MTVSEKWDSLVMGSRVHILRLGSIQKDHAENYGGLVWGDVPLHIQALFAVVIQDERFED